MTTNSELKYEKEELRKMLIAVLDLHDGKVVVSYSTYGLAGERTLRIEPDDPGQRYVLTAS